MAFDRNNNADLQALYDERTNDPITMGYPANDNQFIRQINDGDDNVGGDTIARTFDVEAMLDALDPTELDDPQSNTNAADYTHMLVNLGAESNITAYKAKWRAMFAGNSGTVTALDAQTRPLSRGEVLFGTDTVLVVDDWIAARIFVEGS